MCHAILTFYNDRMCPRMSSSAGFQRVHSVTETSGLGLYIAKTIVELHEGKSVWRVRLARVLRSGSPCPLWD
jgi:hypothetical protein